MEEVKIYFEVHLEASGVYVYWIGPFRQTVYLFWSMEADGSEEQ